MRSIPLLLACLLTVLPVAARAHEFILKPGTAKTEPGRELPFAVLSAHVFMASEEMEDPASLKAWAVDASSSTELALSPDPKAIAYSGRATFSGKGTVMLVGHRLPEVWTRTPEGMKKGALADYPGAKVSNVYEKFCKTLVVSGTPDDGWKRRADHALEIMPMEDPAGYAAGREFSFQILYEGKPLSTEVYATYDGCTGTPNSYAWYTETDDKGVARVKFSSKGLWMVRVQHKVPGKNGIAEHVMRSVLVFNVS